MSSLKRECSGSLSTDGWAALPVFYSDKRVRQNALLEALERRCIDLFNLGKLPLREIGSNCFVKNYASKFSFERREYYFLLSCCSSKGVRTFGYSVRESVDSAEIHNCEEIDKRLEILRQNKIDNVSRIGGGTKMASSRIEYFASSEGAETFCGLLDYALGVSDEIRFDDAFEILEEGKIKNKSFDFFKIYRVILKFSEEYQSRSNDTGDVSYFLLE